MLDQSMLWSGLMRNGPCVMRCCVVQDQGAAMLELRWLLELRMQLYEQAAGTLARVSQAEGGDAQAFAAANRAACLAKLALLADQEGGLARIQPKVGHHQ